MNGQKGYNGWTNYETWAVALWMDNEEGSYHYWREVSREIWDDSENDERIASGIWTREQAALYTLANRLKDEFEEATPDLGASLWADLLGAALSEVEWSEIARHYLDDIEEAA